MRARSCAYGDDECSRGATHRRDNKPDSTCRLWIKLSETVAACDKQPPHDEDRAAPGVKHGFASPLLDGCDVAQGGRCLVRLYGHRARTPTWWQVAGALQQASRPRADFSRPV